MPLQISDVPWTLRRLMFWANKVPIINRTAIIHDFSPALESVGDRSLTETLKSRLRTRLPFVSRKPSTTQHFDNEKAERRSHELGEGLSPPIPISNPSQMQSRESARSEFPQAIPYHPPAIADDAEKIATESRQADLQDQDPSPPPPGPPRAATEPANFAPRGRRRPNLEATQHGSAKSSSSIPPLLESGRSLIDPDPIWRI